MKRIGSLTLALAILWSLCCTIPAFAAGPASADAPESELIFETIAMGDETMVIPVMVETTELQTRTTRSGETYQDVTQAATYYIPATDNGIAYNEAYIQTAQSARLSGTIQAPDPKHYFVITSTIDYTFYNSLDGKTPDSLIGMNRASITKSKDPVGLDWDILDVKSLSVEIVQAGLTDRGHGTIMGTGTDTSHQVVNYTNISWGKSIKTPSNWYPIMLPEFYGVYRCDCYAKYSIIFYYGDGPRECKILHKIT